MLLWAMPYAAPGRVSSAAPRTHQGLVVAAEDELAAGGSKALAAVAAFQACPIARAAGVAAVRAGAGVAARAVAGGMGAGGSVGRLGAGTSYQSARGIRLIAWDHPGFLIGIPAAAKGLDLIFYGVGVAGNRY
jgi:hypothetical protein